MYGATPPDVVFVNMTVPLTTTVLTFGEIETASCGIDVVVDVDVEVEVVDVVVEVVLVVEVLVVVVFWLPFDTVRCMPSSMTVRGVGELSVTSILNV